jgi:outer membrane protein assembly factor BamB
VWCALLCAQSQPPAPFPPPSSKSKKPDRGPTSLFPLQTVWTLPLNSQLAFAPAFDESSAYFLLEGNRLVAYDLLPGRQRWIVSAQPRAAPTTGRGLVFLAEADGLSAIRSDTGTIVWRLPFADVLAAGPVWDNGWLAVATRAGAIQVFRGEDGTPLWSRDLGSPAHARPALAGDRVYVPTDDGRVVALQIESGEPLWERKLGGPADEILALDDRVYVGSKDNHFYCLFTKDGQVDWRWRTGGDVVGVPIVDERRVYFVSFDNMLRALDRYSGVQQWMRPLPLRPTTGPVRAGATIVVTGLAPPLRGYNLKDGTPAGEIQAGAEIGAPPHVIESHGLPAPYLLFVTRDIAKGAAATLVTRSFEPEIGPVSPLPNLITFETPKP